ncbi:MAG: hypothetical protein ACRD15_13560 [Vicinamibacterales bacterium]
MKLPRFPTLTSRELGALIALFVLTLPAVTSRLYSSDEVEYYSYLRSLWFDRDVSFDNEYRHFYDRGVARTPGFHQTFLEPVTPTGLRENFATLGCAVLWAPFYAAADLATRLLRVVAGSELPADGYSRLYVAAVAYGSAIYGFLALLLSVAAARRLTGHGVLAGLAVWFGTPLLFYMYAAPPFSHACSAFAVAVFITVWLRVRARWSPRGLVALGATAALMAMVREQDVFFAVGPALDYALAFRKSGGRRQDAGAGTGPALRAATVRGWILAALPGVAAFVICYSPQLLAYSSLNGRFGPSTLVTRKMTWYSPHAAGVLASPQHGLFAWTPLAMLAVLGLFLLWFKGRGDHEPFAVRDAGYAMRGEDAGISRIAACLLLMLALQVYISGSVESWTVAGAFGQRRFVGSTLLFVVGLAGLRSVVPRGLPRVALATIGALAIWWNVGLTALFGAGLMDRQRLTLRQNAYDVFVTLPRTAPALVYRYFASRESFYKASEGLH